MAWKLRRILRRAPAGAECLSERLEEYEQRMREAVDAPMDDKRNNELTWATHKLHYERNRYVFEQQRAGRVSKALLQYLVDERVCDGALMAKWRKPGYERLCSLAAITKSNTNFGTVSVCRTPLRHRTSQIVPNVMTGCVSCASGDGGPIWWDDPVPDIVTRRIAAIDPGKAALVAGGGGASTGEGNEADEDELMRRARALRGPSAHDADSEEIARRARALRETPQRGADSGRGGGESGESWAREGEEGGADRARARNEATHGGATPEEGTSGARAARETMNGRKRASLAAGGEGGGATDDNGADEREDAGSVKGARGAHAGSARRRADVLERRSGEKRRRKA